MKKVVCKIYGLYSTKEPSRIRYVGQTIQPLKKRLQNHRAKSKLNDYAVSCWIRKHESEGYEIKIKLLTKGIYNKSEIRIIQEYKDAGHDLLNHTLGGEGCMGHTWKLSKKDRKIRSKKLMGNKNKLGKEESEETCRKKSETRKIRLQLGLIKHAFVGKKLSDEHKLKLSASVKGRKKSFQTRLRMKKPKSEEHKNKIRIAALARWQKHRELNHG